MGPLGDHLSSSNELAQRSYNQALELEKQLRVLIQAKGPFDPNVRALRNSIRESYERVILHDQEFSELHDVEQALWRLHYKRIEEFRTRIRKTMGAAGVTVGATNVPVAGSRVATRKEPLQKLQALFKSFLSEATGFYHDLIMKIRAKYGLSQECASFREDLQWPADEKGSTDCKRCQLSCHRCLIFLGDLARYKELHSEGGGHSRDWSVAAGYYLKAASLWPSSGNPHNQLAVLATYVGDELLAVYQYFRSLAVDSPFLTARENLVLLFEKNRQHYGKLSSLVSGNLSSLSKLDSSKAAEKEKIGKAEKMLPFNDSTVKLASKDLKKNETELSATTVITETRKAFRIRFVRLNGILFTRTSLETFPEVYSATMRDLEQLLSCEDSSLESGLGLDHRSGIGAGSGGAAGVVQLVSVLIFSVHNINWGLDAHQPTYAEILQRSALFKHAFTATFECTGRLMRRCAEAEDVSASPLLPAMLIFLEWLACRPDMAIGSEMDEKQTSARSFFWKHVAVLLNLLIEKEKGQNDLVGNFRSVPSGPSIGTRDDCGLALWEDFELRGFTPLVPAQLVLDYSRQPSRPGLGDKEERRVRVQRILGAGKAVANILEESGSGICYDVDLEEFFIAGENRERKIKEPIMPISNVTAISTSKGIVLTDDSALTVHLSSESLANGLSKVVMEEEKGLETPNTFSKSSSGEEEEEELIVFKPLSAGNKSFAQPDLVAQNTLVTSNNFFSVQSSMHHLNALRSSGNTPENSTFQQDLKCNVSAPENSLSKTVASNFTLNTPDSLITQSRSRSPLVNAAANPAQNISMSMNSLNSLLVAHTSPSELDVPKTKLTRGDDAMPKMDSNKTTPEAVSSAVDWVNFLSRPAAYQSSNMALRAPYDNAFSSDLDKLSASVASDWSSVQTPMGRSSWSSELESLARNGLTGLDLSATNGSLLNKPAAKAVVGALGALTAVSDQIVGQRITPITSSIVSLTSLPNQVYTISSTENPNFLGPVGQEKIEVSAALPSVLISDLGLGAVSGIQAAGSTPTPAASHGSISCNGMTGSNRNLVRLSGIRPPPGFGPFPAGKPVSKVETEHPGVLPSQDSSGEGDEQHLVDDYRWLDEETVSKPSTNETRYQRSGSFSSGYGIWSNALSTSGAVAYPFPGMGSSPHRAHQSGLQPFQNQILIQQQHGAQQLQLEMQQQQHLLLLKQQKQQQQLQQPTWFGQYRSQDPFVS